MMQCEKALSLHISKFTFNFTIKDSAKNFQNQRLSDSNIRLGGGAQFSIIELLYVCVCAALLCDYVLCEYREY